MLFARGCPNKRKQFEWHYDPETRQVVIINHYGREFMYSLEEIQRILFALPKRFSSSNISLSNNAVLLANGTEKPGLGATILELFPDDVNRVQGASYLG